MKKLNLLNSNIMKELNLLNLDKSKFKLDETGFKSEYQRSDQNSNIT